MRMTASAALQLFGITIFVGAALLFLVEPMAAKLVLPFYGGSSSVWTTSILFFQAVLLAGYLYAHAVARLLGARGQLLVHAGVLLASLAALPVGRHLTAPPSGAAPSLFLLGVLSLSVGAPFFVLSASSPALQRWFSRTGHAAAGDPYFLYAASNAGSLIALVAYPLLVEPRMTLASQASSWSAAYVAFAALSLCCLVAVGVARSERVSAGTPAQPGRVPLPALAWRSRLRWIFMAFVPSSLMLGTTTYISTDVAAIPLLWVLPLAVYLLTFVVAFSRRGRLRLGVAGACLAVLAVAVVASLLGVVGLPIWARIVLDVSALFFAGVVAHGRLAAERPAPERLTDFYVLLSLGGVLGGVFNALVAPRIFDSVLEYPLAIVLVLLLRPAGGRARPAGDTPRRTWIADLTLPFLLLVGVLVALVLVPSWAARPVLGAGVVLVLLFAARPVRFALGLAALLSIFAIAQSSGALYADRTFFGTLRVTENAAGQHLLVHGTTLHGLQSFTPHPSLEPLGYYSRSGPIGDVFARLQPPSGFRQVGIIGLGVGTLAAYGQPGQTFAFYEIDPAVVRIATDPRLFTYVGEAKARVRIVVGDGRLSVRHAAAGSLDLLVVDAFSSDAIPAHLLTREAVGLYTEKLRPGGFLAFNISNRYLNLELVLSGVARDLGLAGAERSDLNVTEAESSFGKTESRWVVLAKDASRLEPLLQAGWTPLPTRGSKLWTDDFSNVLSVIDWSR